MYTVSSRPRLPWLAALLSFTGGPLGQVYAGRLRRAVCLELIYILLMPALFLLILWLPTGRFTIGLLLPIPLFSIYLIVDAFVVAQRGREMPLKRYQRWWLYPLFWVAFIVTNYGAAALLKTTAVEAFRVGGSMAPTLLPGDRVLTDKLWYLWNPPERNDVVMYRSEGPGSPIFVARVVGLPGEQVEIRDERVFIDGRAWDDRYGDFEGPLPPYPQSTNLGPMEIPPGHVFILGDHRRTAIDSRLQGPTPTADLHAKARVIYWSYEPGEPQPLGLSRPLPRPIRWSRIGLRLDKIERKK